MSLYDCRPHTSYSEKYTPFELVFGRKRSLPNFSSKIDPIYNIDNYYAEIKYKIQNANRSAKELIERHKIQNKLQHDRNAKPINIKINDKVVLCEENRHKHNPLYMGPYVILDIMDENVKIQDVNRKKEKIVQKLHYG